MNTTFLKIIHVALFGQNKTLARGAKKRHVIPYYFVWLSCYMCAFDDVLRDEKKEPATINFLVFLRLLTI